MTAKEIERKEARQHCGHDSKVIPSALALCLATLFACSGGGGGGGGDDGVEISVVKDNPSATFLGLAAEPVSPFAASDWSGHQEYVNSTGLGQLKAAEGYARRSGGLPGGQGVRIAIVDSGIDLTHPDLGNLIAQSWSAGGETLVGEAHATFVAGIAAASRTQTGDANDMHGMAYRASLVNFQAARPSTTQSTGSVSFTTADLIDAVTAAAGLTAGLANVESDIINLSLGAYSADDSTYSSLGTAMRNAAGQGKIMVMAAGNEGLASDQTRKLQPIYPAAYADDPGIAGLAIVVGNLTSTNQIDPSSSHCGDTMNYCLFAPGNNVRSTLNGGGYGIGSGTSFATPYVSGAAAVVKAAFPGVSNQDVVNRLLLTAADLGTAGVDSTFGRGRLDLEAAMNPVGPVGFPVGPAANGPSVPVLASALQLSPAWSIGEDGEALLARAVGFDDLGFPFPADLDTRVGRTRRATGLESFISAHRETAASAMGQKSRLDVAVDEAALDWMTADRFHPMSYQADPQDGETPRLAFRTDVDSKVDVFLSLNGAPTTGLDLSGALARAGGVFFNPASLLAPFDDHLGRQSGGGVAIKPSDRVEIAASAFTSVIDPDAPRTAMQKIDVTSKLLDGLALRAGFGSLYEEGEFFGGRSTGAFGDTEVTRTLFASLSLLGSIGEGVNWFGAYSLGRSSIEQGEGSLFSDWSIAQSEAFAFGLSMRDVFRDGDGLSMMIGQPLRGGEAKTTITLPIGRTPEGMVITERGRIDLAPVAREVTTEIGYRLSFGDSLAHEVKAGGMLRLNPDHNTSRSPDIGLGLRYRWQF